MYCREAALPKYFSCCSCAVVPGYWNPEGSSEGNASEGEAASKRALRGRARVVDRGSVVRGYVPHVVVSRMELRKILPLKMETAPDFQIRD